MAALYSGGLTLEEALQMVASDDIDVSDIYIEPPDSSQLTDEDSANEDEGGFADNLSANQLRAPAELKIVTEQIEDNLLEQESNLNINQGNIVNHKNVAKIDYTDITWVDADLEFLPKPFPEPNYERFKCLTPTETFELFFSDDIISFLVAETIKYSQFKNCPHFSVTNNEMRCFLAILILSGYNNLPGKNYYWDSRGDMGNSLVINAMRRDRFNSILRYIHCADNNHIDKSDKFYKLRPLFEKFQAKFLEYFVPEQDINYDESMVKYFGRHSCKQFIRGKPIRFGYKIWSVNTKSGYLINFIPYQGTDSRISEDYQNVFGKAVAPFMTMLDQFSNTQKKLRYYFYFDNLFTSVHLLSNLKDRGYGGTGTIRDNRVPKNCPLLSKAVMKKKARGEYSHTLDKTNGILLVRWADNNVVSMASTTYGIQPLGEVKRYSQHQKKNIQIPRPLAVAKYNLSMGGTDLMDENIARYRISIRCKKWWWNLFSWVIDAAIQNAWILHKKSGNKLTQLQFRREIVNIYLQKYKNVRSQGGRPTTSLSSRSFSRVADDIRYDNIGHLLTANKDGKRIRCAGENCSSIMRTSCSKCNVGLCINCNVNFHTQI